MLHLSKKSIAGEKSLKGLGEIRETEAEPVGGKERLKYRRN